MVFSMVAIMQNIPTVIAQRNILVDLAFGNKKAVSKIDLRDIAVIVEPQRFVSKSSKCLGKCGMDVCVGM